ncbi:MAG: N-acetylmannosamine-6-phosphate 2-epimerase [Cetobacterium sp.]
MLAELKNKLIVSCQATEDEPLRDSVIIGKLAYSAFIGGASGIRANGVLDIQEIKKRVSLPIIGILKNKYPNSNVFITPTLKEIQELYDEGVEIIAFDATRRNRPDDMDLKTFVMKIKEKFPNQILMGDISTVEEAIFAEKIGIDIVATTLVGYTEESCNNSQLEELEKIVKTVNIPVIAEGNIDTPEKAKKALELGAFAVVVGGAITRPHQITRRFIDVIEAKKN